MRLLLLALSLAASSSSPALAALNEPCYGPNGLSGVCVSTSACSKAGGTTIAGACPADAASVRCCSKPKCGDASFPGGNCRWQSDCAGATSPRAFCPGPAQFKCCASPAGGFGGYPAAPKIPAVGACKKNAVEGARKIVAAFPGRVREVFCTRDCKCPGTSDHCCGLATDMMCADGGGVSLHPLALFCLTLPCCTCLCLPYTNEFSPPAHLLLLTLLLVCKTKGQQYRTEYANSVPCPPPEQVATLSGKEIAEWVMKNRAALKLKYVIWGQKIWSPTTDGAEKSWDKWRTMEDRGDLTQNHWDHVHVSYNG
ncbi:hypothetical protein PCL_05736 [Purpureocillium lilacinum]|uniref:ARB-07466-like C-terminal domain-containing protein n=1 Tax=Purpureocillium lilacinum TaxID=33203 RepID=A0A2U3EKP4_PURLI|nr:hypothetical protein PCL_05736 [Purpureocillium lilacinum]